MAGEKLEIIEQSAVEQNCLAALGHRGKPVCVLDRLDEAEREALSAIWDAHGAALLSGQGAGFASAFNDFWAAHEDRLESLKASCDDSDPSSNSA